MKHIKNRTSESRIRFSDDHSILTAQNIHAQDVSVRDNPTMLIAQNIQAEEIVLLYNCPNLLIAKNIKAGLDAWLDENPSLLELSTTMEGGRILVSFNLRQ